MRTKKILLLIGLGLTSNLVLAEDEEKPGWKGEVGAGYIATTGNSNTSKFTARAEGTLEKEKWRHFFRVTALNSDSNGVTDAERYFISGKSDYKYKEDSYLFGRAHYETDKFSGFDYQYTATAGLGHRYLKNHPAMTLDVEAGAGLKGFRVDGQSEETEALGRLATKYIWKFREKSNFNQELSAEFADSFDVYRSITGLTLRVIGNIALGFAYTVTYTSKVLPGIEKTDTETTINLLYKF